MDFRDKLLSLFEYREGSLIWKVANGPNAIVGAEAGTLTDKGYISVMIDGKQYKAHRLIWIMFNGEIPEDIQIDHRDTVRSNNLLSNLRLADNQLNSLNRNKVLSTTGYQGVTLDKSSGKFRARIKLNGKHQTLGSFCTAKEASDAYQDAKAFMIAALEGHASGLA